jgi:hypothetical protein
MTRLAKFHRAIFTPLLWGALCASVMAEGAVRVLSCETMQRCDAAGQCEPHQETLELRMEPKALNSDGSGEFLLQYGDEEAVPVQALSEAGPFVWSRAQNRYTLLASSDTQFLLHTLSLSIEPEATVLFMTCSFR